MDGRVNERYTELWESVQQCLYVVEYRGIHECVYVYMNECGYIEQGLCEYCVCMMREGVGGCVHGVGK